MWYDLLQCIGPPQCNYTSNECPWQNPEKITYCTWHIWHRKGVIDAEHMGRIWFQDQSDSRSRLAKTFKAYRLTPHQMEKAKSQITELEDMGMISPSTSPFTALLFFIPKKDGRHWMCIDYRKLNKITIQDAYPLPNMESLLESTRGATIFSKFDLQSAYNMFRIRPEVRWKTGFVVPWGLYKFNVMHYGFVNAPACWQQYMDHILSPLIYKQLLQVTVYMDDIGSFAKDTDDAIQLIAICKIVGMGLCAPPSLPVLTLQKLGAMLSNVYRQCI